MQRYWLAAHAYVAVLGPQTVFFDSRQSSFCAVRSNWVYALRTRIEDWALPHAHYSEDNPAAPRDEYVGYLAKRGLLTSIQNGGKRMEQLQFQTPQDGVLDHMAASEIRIWPSKAARIVYSATTAAWRIRHWTFHRLLQELARRREGQLGPPAAPYAQQTAQLTSAYWRFRPLLPFGSHTDFIDSLTLIEFLSHYLVFPKLVIGVRLVPFTTHTWVQEGSTVLNDSPEFVRQFTPIFFA